MKEFIKCANPYMPLWEHVPDGEPRVFEHNGEKRVYAYGSHDIERKHYCGRDQVVWSAPVDDLTDWTYHGVAYETHYDSMLYAPDVVKKGDTYYMYAAGRARSLIVAASSKTPWGPFENPVETKLGFDPGVLVEDDDRAYAYWGGCAAPCYIAELEDDMATIKKDTLVENPLGCCNGKGRYACHIYGGSHKAYIAVDYDRRDEMSTPIVNISSGTTTGFRYLQFVNNAPERVSVVLGGTA